MAAISFIFCGIPEDFYPGSGDPALFYLGNPYFPEGIVLGLGFPVRNRQGLGMGGWVYLNGNLGIPD